MTTPVPGSTLLGATVTFNWNSGSGASLYWLSIGTAPGASDLYFQSQGTGLSGTVNGLPVDGRTLYVRLWSLIANVWEFNDYTYTAAGVPQRTVMTAPPPGSTLSASSVMFIWTAGNGVTQYWISVGTAPGAGDLYFQSQGTSLSGVINGLPTDGRTLYVRLWFLIANVWQFNDYTYRAATLAGQKAAITSPTSGSTLPGASVTFDWNSGSGVSQYFLYVGNSLGTNDVYGQSQGINLSTTVNSLPVDGRTLYVRLWSLIANAWQFNDYTYHAAGATQKSAITAPVPGTTLQGASVTFDWNAGSGVSQYFLYVGTTAGSNDVYGQSQGTNLSTTVNGLPTNGRTLYVRLWSLIASAWQFNDYVYTAATAGAQGFLASPLSCGDPNCSFVYSQGVYTPGIINTVLDHSLKENPANSFWQYGTTATGGGDGVIVGFNGEKANGVASPNDVTCITGQISLSGLVNKSGCNAATSNYVYSSYDEHPGYDYRAAFGTPVKAAAAGTVVNNGGQRCILTNISGTCNDWGYVGIDHGNGYISQYGHLSTISVTVGQVVAQGQQIGLSGHTAPVALADHLHFEMLKLIPGRTANYGIPLNYAVVDPYGWVGSGTDPLYSTALGISPTKLWQ
jgi:Peptidase family M23